MHERRLMYQHTHRCISIDRQIYMHSFSISHLVCLSLCIFLSHSRSLSHASTFVIVFYLELILWEESSYDVCKKGLKPTKIFYKISYKSSDHLVFNIVALNRWTLSPTVPNRHYFGVEDLFYLREQVTSYSVYDVIATIKMTASQGILF